MSKDNDQQIDRKDLREAMDSFGTSMERLELDDAVNKESMALMDRMNQHLEISKEIPFYADKIKDGSFTQADVLHINNAFLVQEIAGIHVLMRGEMAERLSERDEQLAQEQAQESMPTPEAEA